jgi:murein DD-endopeptidase MepM/ murein hydrolase activator NlpD
VPTPQWVGQHCAAFVRKGATALLVEDGVAPSLKPIDAQENKQDMTAINRARGNGLAVRWALILMLLLAAWPAVSGLAQGGAKAGHITDSDGGGMLGRLSLPFKYLWLSWKEPDARLLMPVRGVRVREVKNTWGAARDGGRTHAGQDIFARRGTPIYSATNGYVWHVGESPRGGKTVFVIGAGGRRYYYAHLDKHAEGLAEGDQVTTDTLLGYVGTTGNAKGTPPHLHFSVYTPAGAINPLLLLADRT